MFGKNKKIENSAKETTVEIVKTKHKEANFSVFQIVIFAFLFVLMLWIIGFLSLEIDNQKQQMQALNTKVEGLQRDGKDLLDSYIEKIKDLQSVDIKEQVQEFGMDIKKNIQHVRELMFDKDDLAKVESKIKSLEDYNKTYRGTNLLMLNSSILLKDAALRGESFEDELNILNTIGSSNENVKIAFDNLYETSKTGVKTFSQIRDDFNNMAMDIVFVSNNPMGENPSIRKKFVNRLKSFFKVRKVDLSDENMIKNTPDLIVARVEKYLSERDLNEAIKEFEKLEAVSKEGFDSAKDWYEAAKLKLKVDETINPLVEFSLEQVLNDVKKDSGVKKLVLKKPIKKKKIEVKPEIKTDESLIKTEEKPVETEKKEGE